MELSQRMHELRRRAPLAHVLLVAIVLLWGFGYLLPQLALLGESEADLARARALAAERRQLIADRESIISTYKRFTADRLPQRELEEDATAVMRRLTEQAAASRVDLLRLNPSKVRRVGDLRQVGAEAELVGPLGSLVRYVYELEHGAEPVLVTYLDLRVVAVRSKGLEARITAVQQLP